MKVAKVGEMKDLDRRATQEFGLSEDLLMENAGQAVYFAMLQEIGIKGNRFLVFCGGGNNGGDGLVVARKIHSNGGEEKVFLADDEEKFKGVIQMRNESQSIVFSVDIPSGINGDTGEVMGVAVEADYTVAFGLPKLGNMLYPGDERGGN